MNKIVN